MEPPYRPEGQLGRLLGNLRSALNRDIALLIAGGSLVNVPIGFYFVTFPVYLDRLPHIPLELIGYPLATVGLVAVVFMIPLGILADRFGRRLMLALGGVAGAGAFIIFANTDTFEGIMLGAAVFGLAEAFYFSTWNALLADSSAPETRSLVFGLSFFAAGIAMAVGSLLGWFADQAIALGSTPQGAYQPLLLTLSVAFIPVPPLVLFLRTKRLGSTAPPSLLPKRSLGIIGRFFLANMLVGFGAGLLIPLFPAWFLRQFGVGETFTGPLYAVSSVVNAFAFLVAPTLARRVGIIRSVLTVQVTATVLLFSMPFSPLLGTLGLPAASVLFVARNALMNMAWPVLSFFLMGAVHPDDRATASAVTGVAFRAPHAASTIPGAYLLNMNLSLPFYATTLFYAIGTGALWYFFRGYPEEKITQAAPPWASDAVDTE